MNVPTDISLQVVGSVAAALLVAAVVALIATPVVRSLAFKIGAVDVPRDSRRMHDHPIPRMGGLAIFFGFILSVLLFLPLTTQLRGKMCIRDRSWRDSRGTRWTTCWKASRAFPPTRWVGESGVIHSG